MTFKTILVDCDADEAVAHRLNLAALLSARFGAHLIAQHARPPFVAPTFGDGTFPMDDLYRAYESEISGQQDAARAAFDKAVKGQDIAAEWRLAEGYPDSALVIAARYADLVVVGQQPPAPARPTSTPSDLAETTALASGRPVLVVPHGGVATPPGRKIMLCWNASRESTRAATSALPFLKAAGEVVVLTVDATQSSSGHGSEPGADVALWLSRHGVKVEVQRETSPDDDVGKVMLSRAADYGVDLIVMGVYGHSRVREFVLGGASRSMLAGMTVPVLMAH
jgi:nucleotide-binding universal stress UspA family protein